MSVNALDAPSVIVVGGWSFSVVTVLNAVLPQLALPVWLPRIGFTRMVRGCHLSSERMTVLVSTGFKVTVLEARDRIGGRVFTTEITPNLLSDAAASTAPAKVSVDLGSVCALDSLR
jgi:hypothetical protein